MARLAKWDFLVSRISLWLLVGPSVVFKKSISSLPFLSMVTDEFVERCGIIAVAVHHFRVVGSSL